MEDLCRALTRRELLVQNVDPRSAERGQVAFVQALIREVAYGTLSRRDRRSRHLAAARFFESLGEDELAGALASHYLAAYRAAPDDPDSRPLAAQAKIALRAAASRASSLGSHDQAVRFLVEAIEVTDDPAEIAELLERAGNAAVLGGDVEQAEPLLRDAITRREEMGDRSGAARATCSGRDLSTTGVRRMRLPSSKRQSERTAISPTIPRSRRSSTSSRAGTGSATTRSGRSTSPTAQSGARSGSKSSCCRLPHHEGALLDSSREGTGILEAGIRLAEALGLRETVVRGLLNLGVALIGRDPRSSFERSKAAFDLASSSASGAPTGQQSATLPSLRWTSASGTGPWRPRTTRRWALAPADRASVFAHREEILAARGEPVDDLLAEHERLVAERDDAQQESNLLAGRAAAAFAAGRYGEASAAGIGRPR